MTPTTSARIGSKSKARGEIVVVSSVIGSLFLIKTAVTFEKFNFTREYILDCNRGSESIT
jgi:hypothetical protein